MLTKNFRDLYVKQTKNFLIGHMVERVTKRGESFYRIPEGPIQFTQRLWFEHLEHGDECGGGLWFEDRELIDYDGVGVLPLEIVDALESMGFNCNEQRKYGY